MGLEIALRRIPVIVSGASFVRGKGFTYDVSSAEEYLDLLERVPNIERLSDEKFERAAKYAYHFFFRRQIDFPFIQEGNTSSEVRFGFENLDALLPNRNPHLDVICAGLTTGSEFVID